MDKYLKNKVNELVKSMKKAIAEKDALKDVLDADRIAETNPDEVPSDRSSVLNKEECECKDKKEKDKCDECKDAAPMDKNEIFVKNIMKNFKTISEAYMKKMEQDGSRMATFEEKKTTQLMGEAKKQFKDIQNKDKKKKKDFVRPRGAEEPEDRRLAASEDNEKPFHGYNKEKHSKEGGLSAKAREKYNREEGANLKAPVSSKEAKKSPKKAARRKSFCARMSGNKGPTSKDGKLTPKGAALKRWDC